MNCYIYQKILLIKDCKKRKNLKLKNWQDLYKKNEIMINNVM